MFAADLEASDEIRRKEWRKRSLGNRVKEVLARLLSYWLWRL